MDDKTKKNKAEVKAKVKKKTVKKTNQENIGLDDLTLKLEKMENELRKNFKITGLTCSITYPIGEDKSISLGMESSSIDPISGHEEMFQQLLESMINISELIGDLDNA